MHLVASCYSSATVTSKYYRCDCSNNGQKWPHTVATDILTSACLLLLFFIVVMGRWCYSVAIVQSRPSSFKHVDFWSLDESQWLKYFQFSNRNPNPTTAIEPPVSLCLAPTLFISTLHSLPLHAPQRWPWRTLSPAHACIEVTSDYDEGLLLGALSLSIGSDEEGVWCRSDEEVTWCGSG
jgi:hypothetical protein